MNEIVERFKNIIEIEPDADDLAAIERIEKNGDSIDGITLTEMDALKVKSGYSGKISLRVPKSLHRDLAQKAKDEGISLNQLILYKLAK